MPALRHVVPRVIVQLERFVEDHQKYTSSEDKSPTGIVANSAILVMKAIGVRLKDAIRHEELEADGRKQ